MTKTKIYKLSFFITAIGSCLTSLHYLAAENVLINWSKAGHASYDQTQSITSDKDGNIYIAGPIEDLERTTLANKNELALAKYDKDGRKLWVKQLGINSLEGTYGLSSDPNGGLFLTGSAAAGQMGGIHLSKYDGSGNKIWNRQVRVVNNEEDRGVTTDRAGNLYLAAVSATEKDSAFIFKYDPDANPVWTRQLDASAGVPQGLAADSAGNLFIAGNTPAIKGRSSAYLAKYDADGTQAWNRRLESTAKTFGEDVAVDSRGNVYITGHTNGAFAEQQNLGGSDIFAAKYDAQGNQLWLRQTGTTDLDYAYGAAPNPEDGIFVTGATEIKQPNGAKRKEAFLLNYSADGELLWTKLLGPADAYAAYSVNSGNSVDEAKVKGYSAKELWQNPGIAGTAADTAIYTPAPPSLSWTGEPGYKNNAAPKAIAVCDEAVFRVRYFSLDGYAPAAGYPKVRIRKGNYEIPGSPFTMKIASGTAASGIIYTFSKLLEDGVYSYVFETFDKNKVAATGPAARLHPGIIAVKPDTHKHPLCVHPLIFSPKTGEKALALFNVPPGIALKITIQDNTGKTVRKLYQGASDAGKAEWDGKDGNRKKLKRGIYHITMEGRNIKIRRKIVLN